MRNFSVFFYYFLDFFYKTKIKGDSADSGSKTLPRDELLHGLRSRLRTAGKVSEGDTSEKIESGRSGLTVVTPQKPRERKRSEKAAKPSNIPKTAP